VWWIGKRMVEERERACDEEVLTQGGEPRVYAEAILNVCKLYTESPLECVSGVTGSDLKKRIEAIMTNRIAFRLNLAKKVILAVAGTAALAVPIIIGMMNAPAIRAQAAATPKFEVAAIRACGAGDSGGWEGDPKSNGSSPGRLTLNCRSVKDLIELAYVFNANGHRNPPRLHQPIEGGQPWIDSSRYQVNAKAPTPQRETMLAGPMLQALLEDRFKLKIRRESREVPVYALTVAKGGPKLRATKEGSCIPLDLDNLSSLAASGQSQVPCGFFRPSATDDGLDTSGQTIAGLCEQFSASLDRDVIDQTGIAGRFDIHLALSQADLFPRGDPAEPAPPTDPLANIQIALRPLGLKLESAKAPREFLVIDHVERPSEN
jgi:uncharacterized protein (TIGR03435 family)